MRLRSNFKKQKSRRPTTTRSLARLVVEAATATKAEELVVLDLRRLTSLTDYFVIGSGTSDRHVQAIVDAISTQLKMHGRVPLGREGERTRRWVVVDFGDVVAHVFHHAERAFYQLEKLWGDAPRVKWR